MTTKRTRWNKGVSGYTGKFSIGQTFDLWTIIDNTIIIGKNPRIRARCICGLENDVLITKLLHGKTHGCRKCTASGNRSKLWKGIGDIPRSYINSMKSGAELRNIEFDLTDEYMWNLYNKQHGRCKLSGLEIIFGTHNNQRKLSPRYTASLDRIDSKKGYIVGNVQWVHKDINRIKNNFSQDRFIELCRLVVNENSI